MTYMRSFGRIAGILIITAVVWALASAADPANAQAAHCGDRKALVAMLGQKFKETRHGIGLVSNHRMMELYVSGTGSWTVLFTRPNGLSCIGATGKHWESKHTTPNNHLGPQVSAPAS